MTTIKYTLFYRGDKEDLAIRETIEGEVVPRKGEVIGYGNRTFTVENIVHRLARNNVAEGIDVILEEVKHKR